MKHTLKAFLLFTFLIFNLNVFAQDIELEKQTKQLIKAVTKTLKKESIVREKVDWEKLYINLDSITYSEKHFLDKEKVYSVFIKALRDAGDNHSLFISKSISNEINKVNENEVLSTSKYLENNIGYLKIPTAWISDEKKAIKYTNELIEQIKTLDENDIDKWIIDLRDNLGGNRWPMLSGLTPIIGDGLMGYNYISNKYIPYSIKKGSMNYSKLKTTNYTTKKPFKKIAVMLNDHTGSSGEMVAIAILGFEMTKSFGQASGGYATVNSSKEFKDGTQLYLATGQSADKNKKIYYPSIQPNFPLSKKISEEETMQKVKDWLLQQ